jgi:hypothetical protein
MWNIDLRHVRVPMLAFAVCAIAGACVDDGVDGGAAGVGKAGAPAQASSAVRAQTGLSHVPRPRDFAALDERLRQHYPAEFRSTGRRGSVLLDVSVDARGMVSDVEVVTPPADEPAGVRTTAVMMETDPRTGLTVERVFEPDYDMAFGPAAQAALRSTRFWPAQRGGRAVAAKVRMTVEFTPPAGGR